MFRGLPQGSVLSPILFDVYTSDLERLNSPECTIIQYADDVAVLSNASSLEKGIGVLEKSMMEVDSALSSLGLTLAPEKCILCVFRRHGVRINARNNDNESIIYNNHVIQAKSSIRFLGMYFSSTLNWNLHINDIWKRCQIPLRVIKCFRQTWIESLFSFIFVLFLDSLQVRLWMLPFA